MMLAEICKLGARQRSKSRVWQGFCTFRAKYCDKKIIDEAETGNLVFYLDTSICAMHTPATVGWSQAGQPK